MTGDSTRSKPPRRDLSDLLAGAGILVAAAGAWMFHPGAGLLVLGLALLVGARGLSRGT